MASEDIQDTNDTDKKVDNLSSGTNPLDTDGRVDDLDKGIDTPDTDNIDGGANNPSTGTDTPDTDDTNRGANDPGTGIDILDTDRKAANLGTAIDTIDADANGGVDSSKGTDTADEVGGVDPSTDTDTADKNADREADNLGTETTDVGRQTAASNKTCTSLFFLRKVFFVSFSELETVSAFPPSLFVSSLSPVTLVKQ